MGGYISASDIGLITDVVVPEEFYLMNSQNQQINDDDEGGLHIYIYTCIYISEMDWPICYDNVWIKLD